MAALAAELGLTGSERASLRDIVPALASWRRQRRSWYRVAWRPVPEPAAPVLSGAWLVVVPEDGTDEKLAAAVTDTVTRYGATPVVLTSGELLGGGDPAAALLRELGAGAPEAGRGAAAAGAGRARAHRPGSGGHGQFRRRPYHRPTAVPAVPAGRGGDRRTGLAADP